ncbi:MAG: cellulase family glycosylhydrolase [Oscillospiraceae bacterium]|nr:cellulase family glycosylhydrolase [Oscillospiraceae bacterium]
MRIRRILSLFTAAALAVPMLAMPAGTAQAKSTGTIRDMTTMEIVQDMGLGINLGNTFESCGEWIDKWGGGTPKAYETAWGSPEITQSIIQGYADEGFGVLRVPVAWSNMMSTDGKYTISEAYLARVQQVIDWALETDMYVIVNLHWDGGWLADLPTDHDSCMEKYSVIWTQLSEAFRDYGDKLIFESQNEELYWQSVWNQWGGTSGKDTAYGYCNEVNQTFVDIVRASGGNNAGRHLLISGYNTDVALTCDSMFKMPDDPAGRCAVSVHYYIPATFAILEKDAEWGKNASTWGTDAEVAQLNANMDLLKSTFVDKGIPVIIGEYGCPRSNKVAASVTRYLTSVAEAAVKRGGICPVLWDITNLHYSRKTYKLTDRQLKINFDDLRATYFGAQITMPLGDVNYDGNVNANDASAVLVAAAKIGAKKDAGLTAAQLTAANADRRSDAVNANDASFILRYAAYKGAKGTKTIEQYFGYAQ